MPSRAGDQKIGTHSVHELFQSKRFGRDGDFFTLLLKNASTDTLQDN